MQKQQVKKSEFLTVTTSNAVAVTQNVEADEVYISVLDSSPNPVLIQRERERDLVACKAAHPDFFTGATNQPEWGLLDASFGRVPLDCPIDAEGKIKNLPITTAANDMKNYERIRHLGVGIKEKISLKSSTSNGGGVGKVLIELVNYVPSEKGF